jgi:GT2 family glycosyltransferase
MKLSIVFLNYNRVAETRYTLEQLSRLVNNRDDIEVIAVDNGSSDGTKEFLQTQISWVHVISIAYNTGIAGYNQGFKLAKGDYILVLDDDSHPVDNTTLDRMIHHLDTRPDIGIVACRIESANGEKFQTWHLPQEDIATTSMAFVACGFTIRRSLFERIGWYPEDFFLYQNEMEVAIKVLQQTYKIYYDPQCRVIHRQAPQGRTGWRQVYYPTRNSIWLIRRYVPYPGAAYLIASRLFFGLIRAVQSLEIKCYYQAVRDAFTTPIKAEKLSKSVRKQLTIFWRQNSFWHQLTGKVRN